MQKSILAGIAVLVVAAPAFLLGQAPASATYITDEQVKAVNAQPGTDRTRSEEHTSELQSQR